MWEARGVLLVRLNGTPFPRELAAAPPPSARRRVIKQSYHEGWRRHARASLLTRSWTVQREERKRIHASKTPRTYSRLRTIRSPRGAWYVTLPIFTYDVAPMTLPRSQFSEILVTGKSLVGFRVASSLAGGAPALTHTACLYAICSNPRGRCVTAGNARRRRGVTQHHPGSSSLSSSPLEVERVEQSRSRFWSRRRIAFDRSHQNVIESADDAVVTAVGKWEEGPGVVRGAAGGAEHGLVGGFLVDEFDNPRRKGEVEECRR